MGVDLNRRATNLDGMMAPGRGEQMSKMKRELKIGVVLDRLMKERHLSLKELSYESGVPQSSLGHMLANRQPRELTKNALAICEVFNVSLFLSALRRNGPNGESQP